jgi:hypothetical protein
MLLLVASGGVLLRLLLWWWGGSLSGDEAMLALSIGVRPVQGLVSPPLYDQSAPLLFMIVTKLITMAVGMGEHALRLLPLVSGCLALGLYAATVRPMAGERVAIGACLLLALSATPVHYAVIFKPYAMDLLVGVLALRAGYESLLRPGAKPDAVLLALWVVGPWISASAVFVLCAASMVVLIQRTLSRRALAEWGMVLIVLVGAGSFALAYRIVYRFTADSAYMRDFWAGAYLHFGDMDAVARSIHSVGEVAWGIFSVVPVADIVGPQWSLWPIVIALAPTLLVMITGVMGIVRLVRMGRHWVALLAVMPALVVGAASAAGLYPLAPRLTLCLLPGWLLCVAVEVDHGFGWLVARRAKIRPKHVMTAVCVLSVTVLLALRGVAEVSRHSDAGLLTRWARSGPDPLYVYVRGMPQFLFYSTDWNSPDVGRVLYLHELSHAGAPFFENGASPPPVAAALLQPLWIGGDSLLLGEADGMFIRAGFGWNIGSVGQKWLQDEKLRIEQDGRGTISLLALHNIDAAGTHLLYGMEREGWDCRPVISRNGDFAAQCSRSDDTASTPDR